MSLAQLSKTISNLHLKDVPAHVGGYAREHLTPSKLTHRFNTWKYEYKARVITLVCTQ